MEVGRTFARSLDLSERVGEPAVMVEANGVTGNGTGLKGALIHEIV